MAIYGRLQPAPWILENPASRCMQKVPKSLNKTAEGALKNDSYGWKICKRPPL